MLEFTKTHKFFSQLQMVCRCVKKEDTRYCLAHLEVNEKHIVGTDGRRLGCLDNFGIDPGRYKITKLTKTLIVLFPIETEGNFPKYEDIIPEVAREDTRITIKPPSYTIGQNVTTQKLTFLAYSIAQHKTAAYLDYLKDFLDCTSFHVSAPDRPISFYADGFKGVVMPINVA